MRSTVRYKNAILVTFAIIMSSLSLYWLFNVPERKFDMVLVTKVVNEEENDKEQVFNKLEPNKMEHNELEPNGQEPNRLEPNELAFNELMNYIHHPTTQCQSPVTVGGIPYKSDLDGDKIICLDPGPGIHEGCVVLSFGINNEWSFEEKIHERFKCKVFAFDPSMNKRDHLHSEGIWFYNRGLGNAIETIHKPHGKKWKMNTFGSVVDLTGLSDRPIIDVVKMDIEGSEFPALEDMLKTGFLNKVNHLCVEFHFNFVSSSIDWRTPLKLLKAMTEDAGLGLFSTRINPFVPPLEVPGIPHRKADLQYEMAWVRILQPKNISTSSSKQ